MASSLPASPTNTAGSFHGFPCLHSPQMSAPIPYNPVTPMHRRGRSFPSVSVTCFHTTSHSLADDPTKICSLALYDVLRIPQSASETDVKIAYRRLARQYHPDVVPLQDKDASTKMFLQIHAAYVALSDRKNRARYDLQRSLQEFQAAGATARDMKTQQPSPIRPSSSYCAPPSSFLAGAAKSWETDQCW